MSFTSWRSGLRRHSVRSVSTAKNSDREMREWMQSRQTVLDRLEQSRERENELHILEERTSAALSQISEHRKEFRSRDEKVDAIASDRSRPAGAIARKRE